MLLLLVAGAAFFSVVLSAWVFVFAHHPLGANAGLRLMAALAALGAAAATMDLRRRF